MNMETKKFSFLHCTEKQKKMQATKATPSSTLAEVSPSPNSDFSRILSAESTSRKENNNNFAFLKSLH